MSKRSPAPANDPKGGLATAGERHSAGKAGEHLKPRVKKSEGHMTPDDMRRKGSWAVRFYGRSGKLPPLIGETGSRRVSR